MRAIEAGISNAPGLTSDECIRLRRVGYEAKSALVGCFGEPGGEGCPLTLAGLDRSEHSRDFYRGFDGFIDNKCSIGCPERLRVIG